MSLIYPPSRSSPTLLPLPLSGTILIRETVRLGIRTVSRAAMRARVISYRRDGMVAPLRKADQNRRVFGNSIENSVTFTVNTLRDQLLTSDFHLRTSWEAVMFRRTFEECTFGTSLFNITSLAERHPGLLSLKSVHLSPASWMAVSWYPIYSIPMGTPVKDLSTSFLTYHTLSSSFQDMDLEDEIDWVGAWTKRKEGDGIPLSPFGLVTYKMQGKLWVSGRGGQDQDRLTSFLGVADSWLKQLRVQHHDFDFFTRHG